MMHSDRTAQVWYRKLITTPQNVQISKICRKLMVEKRIDTSDYQDVLPGQYHKHSFIHSELICNRISLIRLLLKVISQMFTWHE